MEKSLNFIYLRILIAGISRKNVSKFQNVHWRNFFTIEMVILANFVQKVIFWADTVLKSGQSLLRFFLFVLPSLRVLKESCFKAPTFSLEEYLYHWKIKIFFFVSFIWKITFEQFWLFVSLLQLLKPSCFNAPNIPLNEYFYDWNAHFCYFWAKVWLSSITVLLNPW